MSASASRSRGARQQRGNVEGIFRHEHRQADAGTPPAHLAPAPEDPGAHAGKPCALFAYLREIDPLVFEELILTTLEDSGKIVLRRRRHQSASRR